MWPAPLLASLLIQSHDMQHRRKFKLSDRHIGHMLSARPSQLEEAIEEGPVKSKIYARIYVCLAFEAIELDYDQPYPLAPPAKMAPHPERKSIAAVCSTNRLIALLL